MDTVIPTHINHSNVGPHAKADYWAATHACGLAVPACWQCNIAKGNEEQRGILLYQSMHTSTWKMAPLGIAESEQPMLPTVSGHQLYPPMRQQLASRGFQYSQDMAVFRHHVMTRIHLLAFRIISKCQHPNLELNVAYRPALMQIEIGCAECVRTNVIAVGTFARKERQVFANGKYLHSSNKASKPRTSFSNTPAEEHASLTPDDTNNQPE